MKRSERALQELQRWVDKTSTGIEVGYTRVAPTMIGDIPHPWMCQAGRRDREYYAGYGVTMDDAIVACHEKWQAG